MRAFSRLAPSVRFFFGSLFWCHGDPIHSAQPTARAPLSQQNPRVPPEGWSVSAPAWGDPRPWSQCDLRVGAGTDTSERAAAPADGEDPRHTGRIALHGFLLDLPEGWREP